MVWNSVSVLFSFFFNLSCPCLDRNLICSCPEFSAVCSVLSFSQQQFGKCVDSFQTGGWTPGTMWHLTLVAVVTDPTVIRLIFGERCMDGNCACFFFCSLLTPTIFVPLSHSFSLSALSYSASVSVSRDMTDRSYSLACQMETDVSLSLCPHPASPCSVAVCMVDLDEVCHLYWYGQNGNLCFLRIHHSCSINMWWKVLLIACFKKFTKCLLNATIML